MSLNYYLSGMTDQQREDVEQVVMKLKNHLVRYNVNIEKVFRQIDKDKSDGIEFNEMADLFRLIEINKIDEMQLRAVFDHIDKDQSGSISLSSFKAFVLECNPEVAQRAKEMIQRKRNEI